MLCDVAVCALPLPHFLGVLLVPAEGHSSIPDHVAAIDNEDARVDREVAKGVELDGREDGGGEPGAAQRWQVLTAEVGDGLGPELLPLYDAGGEEEGGDEERVEDALVDGHLRKRVAH
eukprot:5433657-Pleurochrysis_carterae.AAC.2